MVAAGTPIEEAGRISEEVRQKVSRETECQSCVIHVDPATSLVDTEKRKIRQIRTLGTGDKDDAWRVRIFIPEELGKPEIRCRSLRAPRMERLGRIAYNHKVLTILAFVAIAGISFQLLSGAMDQYWREVEESYVVATRKADEYRALGGTAYVDRVAGGLYDVVYSFTLSQPMVFYDGITFRITFDGPIPPDP